MAVQIFKLFRLIFDLFSLVFIMLQNIEQVCVEITKWYWFVLILVFGLLRWPLYRLCEFVLSKIDGKRPNVKVMLPKIDEVIKS